MFSTRISSRFGIHSVHVGPITHAVLGIIEDMPCIEHNVATYRPIMLLHKSKHRSVRKGFCLPRTTAHQAQIHSPKQSDDASHDDSVLNRHQSEVQDADRWPQFDACRDQRPESVSAVCCDSVERSSSHETDAGYEEDRIESCACCLIECELDGCVADIEGRLSIRVRSIAC